MRICKVQAWPIRLPRDLNQATGTAGSPTELEAGKGAYRWSPVVGCLYSTHFETALVRVELDEGLSGWGEAQAPLAPEVACEIIHLLLAPVLEGEPFDGSRARIEALWDRMYATMRVRGQTGGFMLDAISGVDLALWDLAGKIQSKPVCALLAAAPKRAIPAYVSGLPERNRPATAADYIARGFRKFKLFFDTDQDGFFRQWDQLPPEADYAVDALWRLTPQSALEFGRKLDARGALWLEAPLPPEDAQAHGALAHAIRTPIALGESYRTRYELAPFFQAGAVGVLQPDLGRCGITEGMRLAAMAEQAGVAVVPHLSIAMGPQIAAALHLAAAVNHCTLVEFNPQVLSVANRFLLEPLRMEGPSYVVPKGPGLGVVLERIPT